MSRRNKLIWFLVGCWLAVAFVPVAQADFDAGLAAYKRGDFDTAFKEFKPLAEQGHAAAQNYLGVIYDSGLGVPQDYEEGIVWFRKAAEQGYASAQNNLGVMYESGHGVPQDYALAHMWYNLAAAQGNETGGMLRDGLAETMTPEQIAEAQRLAREWKPSNQP